jgi:hypothetical protein
MDKKTETELSIHVYQLAEGGKDVVCDGNLQAFLSIALGNFSKAVLKACNDAGMLVYIKMQIESESSCKGPRKKPTKKPIFQPDGNNVFVDQGVE